MNAKISGLLLLFLLTAFRGSAQECDCLSQFFFVKNYIEQNNPAFQQIKQDGGAYKKYRKQAQRIAARAKQETSTDRCNRYFEAYIALIKDHHSGVDVTISRLPIDLRVQSTLDSFKQSAAYQAFEKMQVDTAALRAELQRKSVDDIEGLYSNGGSLYFGIVQIKRDRYKGIILQGTRLLDVGHVILDIRKRDKDNYEFVFHTGLLALNFQHIYRNVRPEHGRIPEFGFAKTDLGPVEAEPPYAFRVLDASTNYLKLASFDMGLKEELDAFYQSIDSAVQSKPNLIIDLRDNGGGAEVCYLELLKYLYTRPLRIDPADVWVSPDNIRKYEQDGHPEALIERMKNAAPFSFIPQAPEAIAEWTLTGTANPQKVALLFNRKTASSAEGLILYGMQSEKVVTLGENSGGYLGYGNVKTEPVPCGKYAIRSTTTRYPEKSQYEFSGIPPQVRLSEGEDWIGAARSALGQ